MEWMAAGESLLLFRRIKTSTLEDRGIHWDLSEIDTKAKPGVSSPEVVPDMVIPDVSVEHMAEKADFAVYSRLRERRRELAEQEAVPVYAVCTNEQLAEMAKRRVSTPGGLQEIEGFGEAKAAKYAAGLLEVLGASGASNEAGG